MPTFGGFLKKIKTHSTSKESGQPASPVAETKNANIPTAEVNGDVAAQGAALSQTASAHKELPDGQQQPATSNAPAAQSNDATNPMNSSAASPSLNATASNQSHSHQNAASINNLINPPQQDRYYHAAGGTQTSTLVQNQQDQQVQQHTAKPTARQTKGKYSLDDFTMQRTLGTGSFGRVHLVQSKHNRRFYAIKVLKKAQVVKMKQVEHTNDERRMLQRVKHPFLVTLWGTFQDSKNLYMVMDFVEGGELFSLLRKSQVSLLNIGFILRVMVPDLSTSDFPTRLLNSMPRRSLWP